MSLAEPNRYAVTGVGLVSGYGIGADLCFEGLLARERAPRLHDVKAWPVGDRLLPVAGPDRDQVTSKLPSQQLASLNMEARMALAACLLALEDAGLDEASFADDSCGVVVAAQHAGLQDYADLWWAGMRADDAIVSPTRGPRAGFNAVAGYLGIRTGARGPNVTILNGVVGGVDAILYAMDAIARGEARAMLVCGVGFVHPVEVPLLADAQPEWEPKPFDVGRRGSCFGNAAAALLIEAPRRDAKAMVTAAHAAYSPDMDSGASMYRALSQVLAEDGRKRVAACFAGANGSLMGDAVEAGALSTALDYTVPVCAVKGGMGECLAASVVAQVAMATLSLRHSFLPPTPGLGEATGLLRLRVPREPEKLSEGTLLVHGWDAAGGAGAVALRDPEAA